MIRPDSFWDPGAHAALIARSERLAGVAADPPGADAALKTRGGAFTARENFAVKVLDSPTGLL